MTPPDIAAILRHHRHRALISRSFAFLISRLGGDGSANGRSSPVRHRGPQVPSPFARPVMVTQRVTQRVTQDSGRCVTMKAIDFKKHFPTSRYPVAVVTQIPPPFGRPRISGQRAVVSRRLNRKDE